MNAKYPFSSIDYEKELQALKTWDEVQMTTEYNGYKVIETSGHGYLVVPKEDENYQKALSLCSYGFKGKLAVYLEEDCELPAFFK